MRGESTEEKFGANRCHIPNTSDIVPTAITGDMHSVNKANFAILYSFGRRFAPRFTDLDERLKDLYCADDTALYEKCLVRPVGQIDRQAIMDEKTNISTASRAIFGSSLFRFDHLEWQGLPGLQSSNFHRGGEGDPRHDSALENTYV